MRNTGLPINLALQGGGSHGALAWGVLDRLLEEPGLEFTEISGTSAGAMNAVVLAHGMEVGGREGARKALFDFWKAVSDAARYSPIQRTPWDRLSGDFSLDNSPGYLVSEGLSRVFSPYELNPFDLNPLRDLLAKMVDFDAINRSERLKLHLTATNVRTGLPRIFTTGELSSDTVMASACLPLLYRAVEIDGEAYWDGGYSANPALTPLVMESGVRDILIVQLNPMRRDKLPGSAREIINRINEISFNTSLLKEFRALGAMRQLIDDGIVELPPGAEVRLHMIHCETDLQDMSSSSKLNAEWKYIDFLFARGRIWAEDWLSNHLQDVGKTSSFRAKDLFEKARLPPGLAPITRD
ncbi:patatin-like phospholipase family protein [Paracoccus sp. MBLB3053]|uniref:Patatin-like phospholipase family protein n=1 Tax=Paracoccus aurantius TaxID=3073814 RepID=A0ABU2HVL1_9RHOB|nr:patatin-like phospholipase family protein [Paracoccus sp. MBLB3053]MDS9469071.1 patatin-like phospholipase family protein [Paracoccus sp. MBLB3053]